MTNLAESCVAEFVVDFAMRAERYAQAVVAGVIVACKWVKAACQRHLDDLQQVVDRNEAWPYYFDIEEANRVCQFIEQMPHIKGEGAKPLRTADGITYPKLELEDWQVFFVAIVFGWLHCVTRLRRFRRVYLEVARKNAKSTLLAGIALYMLSGDGEEGPEVYCAATKKDQAKIIWEEVASEMIRRQPEFKQLGVSYNKSRIYCTRNGGKFTPLARDFGSLDGLNTSCFISDELHAQRDRKLYDVLDSSTGARSQPLGIGITTAGTDRSGVCYAQRTYVTKLLNTVLHRHEGMGYTVKGGRAEDDSYFGVIYTLDADYPPKAPGEKAPKDEWGDEAVWAKANPMLLATRNAGYAQTLLNDLRSKVRKALSMPSEQSEFRTKHCNEWLNADTAWMDMHAWNECADPQLSEDEFEGHECYLGLDAAFKTDIFANMKLFERDGHYYGFGRYYAPKRMVRMSGNEHIAAWADQKLITETPGEVVNIEVVRDDMTEDRRRHEIREVAYDPAQLTQFAGEQIEDGFEMVEIRPTVMNFSEAMKKLFELVLEGKFHHNGDPVLEWMVSNVVCHRDHKDNIYPNKEKDENKIDGVLGLIMALARAIANGPQGTSFWETAGQDAAPATAVA